MHNKHKKNIIIQKISGETEPFDVSKLKTSLKNAGADSDIINEIADVIENWVYDGITTRKIYARAYRLLWRKKGGGALRYRLKKALFDMGPSGYPFEFLISELFRQQGFNTKVAQIVEGIAITHEIDVIAAKDKERNFMECKYSQDQGKRISIRVPLYVRARVDDIIEKRKQDSQFTDFSFTAWVVTNARFSSDSEKYSESKGIKLLGWDYPRGSGLKHLIEKEKIFPVTILVNLTEKIKQQLMEQGIVTCAQLLENRKILKQWRLSKRKQRDIIKEIEALFASFA